MPLIRYDDKLDDALADAEVFVESARQELAVALAALNVAKLEIRKHRLRIARLKKRSV